jgi:hypothetical protein
MPVADPIKELDTDIVAARKLADTFMEYFGMSLAALVAVVVIYLLPGIATTFLPENEKELLQREAEFKSRVTSWEVRHKLTFTRLDKDQFKEKQKSGTATTAEIEANQIEPPQQMRNLVGYLRFASKFQSQSEKLELLLKTIPAVLAALAAGFLITYRFHAKEAGELVREKHRIRAAVEGIHLIPAKAASGSNENENTSSGPKNDG